MNFFERRKYRKLVEALLHDARHVRGMREDVAPAADLERMAGIEQKLKTASKARDAAAIDACAEELGTAREKVWPPRRFAVWRENIEMFVVVLAVATGIRAYVIAPFKIPTGSMQPTLNGITAAPQSEAGLMDRFPFRLIPLLLFGESFVEVYAPESGVMVQLGRDDDNTYWQLNDKTVKIPSQFFDQHGPKPDHIFFKPASDGLLRVEQGQLLALGRVRGGDMIFVDRIRYNFLPMRRGDIIVFRTAHINYANVQKNQHYIKRLVGLPGETIQIHPPYLVVNGKQIEHPFPFHRLLTDPRYAGYVLMPGSLLATADDKIPVGPNEFLPFGDNTKNSQDGRYFGPVPRGDLLGPAFMVFWPFGGHWGLVR